MLNDNYNILNDSILQLPIFYSEGSCEQVIVDRLSEYRDFLMSNNIGDVSLRESIDLFIGKVSKMYEEYYLGHQNKAYALFKEAFEYETRGRLPVKTVLPKEPLYRARINNNNIDYSTDEMFHIKYSLRSKVKTQRYSFPGLPCLYLGASSYVCWLELDRPQMEQFQVAEILQRDKTKDYEVIDFCVHPHAFYKELIAKDNNKKTEHENLTFDDYLRWWPIMAVCSVAVKNEDDPFKPEYIFPQFVLQYYLEEKMDDIIGIKYMSIKAGRVSMKQYESDYRTYANYVIPIKSLTGSLEEYCCELSNQFEVKNTVSGKEHQMISDMVDVNQIKWEVIGNDEEIDETPLDKAVIYTKSGIPLHYGKSGFRKIEKILSGEIIKELVYDDECF